MVRRRILSWWGRCAALALVLGLLLAGGEAAWHHHDACEGPQPECTHCVTAKLAAVPAPVPAPLPAPAESPACEPEAPTRAPAPRGAVVPEGRAPPRA
jgi:hypothetical protein